MKNLSPESQAVGRRLSFAWRALCDVLLPACCFSCGDTSSTAICQRCQDSWPRIVSPCPRCGHERSAVGCPACRDQGFPGINEVSCTFRYDGNLRRLIRRAKVQRRRELVLAIVRHAPRPAGITPQSTLVVLPSSSDQPHHLATQLAQAWSFRRGQVRPWLQWRHRVAVQHRLSVSQRRHNVQDALIADPACRGQHITLIDDIVTSGNSLIAAARALRQAGAQQVDVCCLARAMRTPAVAPGQNAQPNSPN